MTRILVDQELASKLSGLGGPVQLCDSSGQVLGLFSPQNDMTEWEPVTPEVSDEELDRRERSNEKRYTTAEVLNYLKDF
jgi:hypothetical protein